MPNKNTPVLAIVGRPNVGKSTFYNRLKGRRTAIVIDQPGVTRDRNYGYIKYGCYEFILIDTGGFDLGSNEALKVHMRKQSELAVDEADVVLFMVDGQLGWKQEDEELYRWLVKKEKPLFLLVNKVDNQRIFQESYEFYKLGVENIYPISCEHKTGIEQLLEDISACVSLESENENENQKHEFISLAVVGKPNAGKSSLVNAILGEERMIVDAAAGTTRDSIDSLYSYQGQKYLLIDTAGIRKRGKVTQKVETYSIVSALKSIERADIVLLVVDVSEGVTDQVLKVAGYIGERKKGMIIVLNKGDLLESSGKSFLEKIKKDIYEEIKFIDYAPIIIVSAKSGENADQVIRLVKKVYEQYVRRIQTADLNMILDEIFSHHPPPSRAGRPTKIYYATQVSAEPPTFVFKINYPEKINSTYERYVIHQLRYHFGFQGTPLEIIWRKKGEENKVGTSVRRKKN
ncbi:ribosome biogenesis GTPase Der [Deltaproteobacteria bacterium TL4]